MEICNDFFEEFSGEGYTYHQQSLEKGMPSPPNAVEDYINEIFRNESNRLWLDKRFVKHIKGHHLDTVPSTVQLRYLTSEVSQKSLIVALGMTSACTD